MLRRATALAVAIVLACGLSRVAYADDVTESWATARARSLVEAGQSHRHAGHVDLALARFHDAIEMDGTYGPAYIALAELREATGEIDEADRVLTLGLERIPAFTDALAARGALLTRAGRNEEATAALLAALDTSPDDVGILSKIVAVAPKAGRLPVALAAARRLATLAHERGDTAAERDARLTAKALVTLLGDVDPVARGSHSPERSRRALAALASSISPAKRGR
jgi:tetratricopeptide (TPR) repeat protein